MLRSWTVKLHGAMGLLLWAEAEAGAGVGAEAEAEAGAVVEAEGNGLWQMTRECELCGAEAEGGSARLAKF